MSRRTRDLAPLHVVLGALEGIIAGWIIYELIVLLDIAGIGGLMDRVAEGQLVFWIGAMFFGITFGMVGIAWRIMVLVPDHKD